MKITVIGFWGAYPEANSAASGYLVQTENINLLIDCGSGVLSLLQNYVKLEELDAVILSHYHGDHMADLRCLQYSIGILSTLNKRSKILDIYGINEKPYFDDLNYKEYCRANIINKDTILRLEDLTITFTENTHPVPCLSIKVQNGENSFVYTADTGWSENIAMISKNVDVLISECSLYNDQFGKVSGHLTAGEAGRLASICGVNKLILTHLPHYGDHNVLVKQAGEIFKGEVLLAEYGMTLQL